MINENRLRNYLLKAKNDLEEAQLLLSAEYTDGACNRAYYTLFDCLMALLHSTGGPVPKTHTGTHTEFRRQFILGGMFDRVYSNTITELFNLRQGGDYEIDFDISLDDAQDAVRKVTEFLLQTEAYLRENGFAEPEKS